MYKYVIYLVGGGAIDFTTKEQFDISKMDGVDWLTLDGKQFMINIMNILYIKDITGELDIYSSLSKKQDLN